MNRSRIQTILGQDTDITHLLPGIEINMSNITGCWKKGRGGGREKEGDGGRGKIATNWAEAKSRPDQLGLLIWISIAQSLFKSVVWVDQVWLLTLPISIFLSRGRTNTQFCHVTNSSPWISIQNKNSHTDHAINNQVVLYLNWHFRREGS